MTPAARQLAAAMASAKPRRSKFGARPVTTEDGHFASQAEHRRWAELRLLERAGQIASLKRQVRYNLHALNGDKVGVYVSDFDYVEPGRGLVSEDVKGFATPLYRWKRAHFEAEYRRPIVEIKAR